MAGKHRAARRRTPGPFPLSTPLPSALRNAQEQMRAVPQTLRTSPRPWSAVPLSWRTTGGVLAGVAVLGTAAATAQASVLPFDAGTVRTAAQYAVVQDDGGPSAGGSATSDEGGRPGGSGDGPRAAGSADDGSAGGGSAGGGSAGGGSEPEKKSEPTAEDAIAMAKKQVGIEEDAAGETKFNDWYVESERSKETVERDGGSLAGYSDAAWCSMFISWVGSQIGASDQFGHDAYTVTHAQWFKDQGRWGTEPEPGAVVFFDWGGGDSIDAIDHVGMVIEKIDDGTIRTVEGNTDSAVKIRERSASSVVGYGYPEYAEK